MGRGCNDSYNLCIYIFIKAFHNFYIPYQAIGPYCEPYHNAPDNIRFNDRIRYLKPVHHPFREIVDIPIAELRFNINLIKRYGIWFIG